VPPFDETFEGQRDLRAENWGADLRAREKLFEGDRDEFLRRIRGVEMNWKRPLMAMDSDNNSESKSGSELGEKRVETNSDPESSSSGEVL